MQAMLRQIAKLAANMRLPKFVAKYGKKRLVTIWVTPLGMLNKERHFGVESPALDEQGEEDGQASGRDQPQDAEQTT